MILIIGQWTADLSALHLFTSSAYRMRVCLKRKYHMEKFRIDKSKGIEIGLYSLGDHFPHAQSDKNVSEAQRLREIVSTAVLAEQAGLDVIGVGESHQQYFITSANQVVLGAIAQATEKIKIASSVTVLSTADPVRVYEE